MKGSTYGRCGCRDDDGKLLGKHCPDLAARKRGHGTWFYSADVGLVNGKRRQQRKGGFSTKAEAQEALTAVLSAVNTGEHRHDNRRTVGDYLTAWVDRREGTGAIRAKTAVGYRAYVVNDLVPALGAVRLGELRPGHVQDLVSRLTADGRGAPTVRRIHSALRTALASAKRERLVTYNAAVDVELPREHRDEVQPWTGDELADFLHSVREHRLSALFEVAARTGLRRGEVCGLRWSDLRLDDGVMTIRTQLVEVNGRVVEGPPKTKAGQRKVDLSPHVVAVLRAHRARQAAERLALGEAYSGTDRVFVREDGVDLRPGYVTKLFRDRAGKAGLRPIGLHDLRHGAASLMLAAGVPLLVVSKRLGHSSLAITADLYSHLLPGVGRAAAEATDAGIPLRGVHA